MSVAYLQWIVGGIVGWKQLISLWSYREKALRLLWTTCLFMWILVRKSWMMELMLGSVQKICSWEMYGHFILFNEAFLTTNCDRRWRGCEPKCAGWNCTHQEGHGEGGASEEDLDSKTPSKSEKRKRIRRESPLSLFKTEDEENRMKKRIMRVRN